MPLRQGQIEGDVYPLYCTYCQKRFIKEKSLAAHEDRCGPTVKNPLFKKKSLTKQAK